MLNSKSDKSSKAADLLKPLTHHKMSKEGKHFFRLAAVTGGGGGYPVAEPEPGNFPS